MRYCFWGVYQFGLARRNEKTEDSGSMTVELCTLPGEYFSIARRLPPTLKGTNCEALHPDISAWQEDCIPHLRKQTAESYHPDISVWQEDCIPH